MAVDELPALNAGRDELDLREAVRLLDFAAASATPTGFADLDATGRLCPDSQATTLVTARMTYCFAIGALLGSAPCAELSSHGVSSLWTWFRDSTSGTFYATDPADTTPFPTDLYATAFVLLAAAAGAAAGIEGAGLLLDSAPGALDRFWDPDLGVFRNAASADFAQFEPYLGANGNMHAVEALMAAAGVVDRPGLVLRALDVATFFVDRHARAADWMLPEHFTTSGAVVREYNRDRPTDEFRPYGVTIGHLFEWSRLLWELRSALASPPAWLTGASGALYARASELGWVDGVNPGFLYTVGWDGEPVVGLRPHWVLAEAISAAGTRWAATGKSAAQDDLRRWSEHARRYYLDFEAGSWHHELDGLNHPSHRMWTGKPDIYHALTASLIPQLPIAPSLVRRLQRRQRRETW